MFVTVRLGLFVRVVVVAAIVLGGLLLMLGAQSRPQTAPPEEPGSKPESVLASEAPVELADELEYRVSGTGGAGLNIRACPRLDCVEVAELEEGGLFLGACWQRGAAVSGDDQWVRGTAEGRNGRAGYASARYLRAPADTAPSCEPRTPATLAG